MNNDTRLDMATERERHRLRQALIPAEQMALTVARSQIGRGETPSPNVSIVCIAALCRLIGVPLPEVEYEERS